MTDTESLSETREAHRQFLALVADVRPDLHRYCARMTGSVSDGEDLVQETLARAYAALSEVETLPPLRAWLFQIAHRRALDYLRRYERRMSQPLDVVAETAADGAGDAEDALAREEAVRAAVARFLTLPPAQRSCVILKDVLGHSADEIAALLELTVPAVEAALHRGRAGLRARSQASPRERESAVPRDPSPAVVRYSALFNARDWDGVRAMLAEDVRLDLVSRVQRVGRRAVGGYVSNYDAVRDWHLVPAWLDGREVLAVFRDPRDARPGYWIELTLADERVAAIRDFRFVPYIAVDAAIEFADAGSAPASDGPRRA